MTHTELKAVIQELILDLYGKEFVGKMEIKDEEPEGYTIKFETIQDRPYSYTFTMPDDQVIKHLTEELRHAAFLSASRHSIVRNTTTFQQNKFIRNAY